MPATLTWSDDLTAEFVPATGELSHLEQWGNFRFQEGARNAKADRAAMAPLSDVITLSGAARVWDPEGSTSADEIVLNRAEEAYAASGNVSTTFLPNEGTGGTGFMRSGEPVHARAAKMTAASGGATIAYEGGATLWQGANRLLADRIDIDRKEGTLLARGNVTARMVDILAGAKSETDGAPSAIYTTVTAGEMLYTEAQKLAHYRGEVRLTRPGLEVTAGELMAYFQPEPEEAASAEASGLDHLRAEGDVRIEQREAGRHRTGTAERAEYHLAEDRVTLQGGRPRVVDTERGTTEGNELTYYSRSDRLLVDGAETQPAVSRLGR
jgi:lipopolysaccharide transport protein LptA